MLLHSTSTSISYKESIDQVAKPTYLKIPEMRANKVCASSKL